MIAEIDALLRGTGRYRAGSGALPWMALLLMLALGGLAYGACMGSFAGRPLQSLYSATKVPLFVITATLICLPSFYALNALLGLGDDFRDACRGVFASQATLAVMLLALAPLIVFAYASSDDYNFAVLANGASFLVATIAAQMTLGRHYRVLIARNPAHRIGRNAWVVLYVFVAVQCAWVLRPFIGAPQLDVRFFRENAWSNAYVVVAEMILEFTSG